MAIQTFTTKERVAWFMPELLHGQGANPQPDEIVNGAAIDEDIQDTADDILDNGDLHGYDLNSPTVHQTDLLRLLNGEAPGAALIQRRGSACPDELLRYAGAQASFAELLIKWYRQGRFFMSFSDDDAIDQTARVALATVMQCGRLQPNFKEEDNLPPSSVIQEWIYEVSAMVYSLAAVQGYPTPANIEDLTERAYRAYSRPVRYIVGSRIIRVIMAVNNIDTAAADYNANKLLKDGKTELIALMSGKTYKSFE